MAEQVGGIDAVAFLGDEVGHGRAGEGGIGARDVSAGVAFVTDVTSIAVDDLVLFDP